MESGDFLVLFGPNGAGKTTLIKILSTLSRATSGDITINGYDIKEDPIEVRNSIGVLSHNPLLYEDLTKQLKPSWMMLVFFTDQMTG